MQIFCVIEKKTWSQSQDPEVQSAGTEIGRGLVLSSERAILSATSNVDEKFYLHDVVAHFEHARILKYNYDGQILYAV